MRRRPSGGTLSLPFDGHFRELPAGARERGGQTGKGLPPKYCNVDVSGIDLDRQRAVRLICLSKGPIVKAPEQEAKRQCRALELRLSDSGFGK